LLSVTDNQGCLSAAASPRDTCTSLEILDSPIVFPSRPLAVAVRDTIGGRIEQYRPPEYKGAVIDNERPSLQTTGIELASPQNRSRRPRKILTPVPPSSWLKNAPRRCSQRHIPLQMPSRCDISCSSLASKTPKDGLEDDFEKIDGNDIDGDWTVLVPAAGYRSGKEHCSTRMRMWVR
jgi:hypothetical protein